MQQHYSLTKLHADFDHTLYVVSHQPQIEILLASTSQTRKLLTTPEIAGMKFQEMLSNSLQNILKSLYQHNNTLIHAYLHKYPTDVLYILRGGLNFDLHHSLTKVTGIFPEVSFITSQRIENQAGFDIAEDAYSKWSIQPDSVLCIGDISATSTTFRSALTRALVQYKRNGISPKRILLFTIGTGRTFQFAYELKSILETIEPYQIEGITLVFLESVFHLYEGDPFLAMDHLAYTDFFKIGRHCSPEYESSCLEQPVSLLERCAIYDGGSRSYEPKTYLRNLKTYWMRLADRSSEVQLEDLLRFKSSIYDYAHGYEAWRSLSPWWHHYDDEIMMPIYHAGVKALEILKVSSLKEICANRISEIEVGEEDTHG